MRLLGCVVFFLFILIWDIARNWSNKSQVMILRRVLMVIGLLMVVGGVWLMSASNFNYWVLAATGSVLLIIVYAYCW